MPRQDPSHPIGHLYTRGTRYCLNDRQGSYLEVEPPVLPRKKSRQERPCLTYLCKMLPREDPWSLSKQGGYDLLPYALQQARHDLTNHGGKG